MSYLSGNVHRTSTHALEHDLPVSACDVPVLGIVYYAVREGGSSRGSSSSSGAVGFSGSLMT